MKLAGERLPAAFACCCLYVTFVLQTSTLLTSWLLECVLNVFRLQYICILCAGMLMVMQPPANSRAQARSGL